MPKQNRGEKWVFCMSSPDSPPALLHRDFAPFRPPQPPSTSRVRPYIVDRAQGQAGDEARVLLPSNPARLFLFARIPTASPLCPGPHLAPVLPPHCSHVPPSSLALHQPLRTELATLGNWDSAGSVLNRPSLDISIFRQFNALYLMDSIWKPAGNAIFRCTQCE